MSTKADQDAKEVASSQGASTSTAVEEEDTTPTLGSGASSTGMGRAEIDQLVQGKVSHLFRMLEPFVHQLDDHVTAVRTSQELLNQELESLLAALATLRAHDLPASLSTLSVNSMASLSLPPGRISNDITIDLEDKSRRLLGLKRRLTLVHSILSTVNSRVKKLVLAHNARIVASGPSVEVNE